MVYGSVFWGIFGDSAFIWDIGVMYKTENIKKGDKVR